MNKPANAFEDLAKQSDQLLEHVFYLNMKACDICIQGIDKLEEQGKNHGAGRELIVNYLNKHRAVVRGVIEVLGYEPDFMECHERYANAVSND